MRWSTNDATKRSICGEVIFIRKKMSNIPSESYAVTYDRIFCKLSLGGCVTSPIFPDWHNLT